MTEAWLLTTAETADRLGLDPSSVTLWRRQGRLEGVWDPRQRSWLFTREAVDEVASAREHDAQEWVTARAAAELAGCSRERIRQAVSDGDIRQRDRPNSWPSLWRADVEVFAARWRKRLAIQEERAAEKARRRAEAQPPGPPGEWLPVEEASTELGMHPESIRRLLRSGSLTGARRGVRWWVSRESVRTYQRRA